MENNPQSKPEAYSPYSAFPSYERTKVEIIDAWLAAINSWKFSMQDQGNENRLKSALLDVCKWYVLIHGYRKAMDNKELDAVKKKLSVFITPGRITSQLITHTELNAFMLTGSEYMNELKITGILQHHEPDEYALLEGAVGR